MFKSLKNAVQNVENSAVGINKDLRNRGGVNTRLVMLSYIDREAEK